MNSPITSPQGVQVRHTGTGKGYGVFSTRRFVSGGQIEVCPVILLEEKTDKLPEPIRKRVFDWGILASSDIPSALALGFGSMYNHDNPANMRYLADSSIPALIFEAVRDIDVNEELTINYNALMGEPEWHDDNWFKRMDEKRQ